MCCARPAPVMMSPDCDGATPAPWQSTDAHGSCVGGTFRAQPCWDELDLDGPRGARDRAPDGGVVEDVPSRGGRTTDGGVPDGGAR